jgi:hypothetical protein
MERAIGEFLSSLQLGEMRTYKNFAVIPVFSEHNGGPIYRSLKKHLTKALSLSRRLPQEVPYRN